MLNFLTSTGTGAAGTQGMTSIIMMVVMIAVFYFFMIRPENKKRKAEDEMRAAIRNGDVVTSIGGIVVTVVDVKEDKVVIETGADRVRIEFVKSAIGSNETAAKKAEADAKKAKEAQAKAKAAKKADK